jgi:hypothetical protein
MASVESFGPSFTLAKYVVCPPWMLGFVLHFCHTEARACSLCVTLMSHRGAGVLTLCYTYVTLRRGRARFVLHFCHTEARACWLGVTLMSH